MNESHNEITRRGFLGTVAATAALGAAGGFDANADVPKRKPNVLYLFSDQHRWQSLSFTEQPELKTPNFEKFAKEGLAFSHCISNYPVCSPYRAIFMTGRWPYQTGIIDNEIVLSKDEVTLGKVFKSAGYKTGYIGKWHLNDDDPHAEAYGFDHSLIWTGTNKHWDKSLYHPAEGEPVQLKGYNATLMTDQALTFIDKNKDEPFFLAVAWNPPHGSFLDAPEPQKILYPEGTLPFRPNVPHPDSPKWTTEIAAGQKDDVSGGGWNRHDWASYQGYHAHISAIDEELGRVLKKLDELNLTNDTIVVYTSDHGSMQCSHALGGKRQAYDESIRVPFIVRYPGVIKPDSKSNALFGAIDIAPTVVALAGIERPETFAGRDFSPLIRGEAFESPASQLIMHVQIDKAHPAPLFRGLRTAKYTYAENVDGSGFLFDNDADPYQLNNRYDAPELAELRATLHKELIESLKRAHDPLGSAAVA